MLKPIFGQVKSDALIAESNPVGRGLVLRRSVLQVGRMVRVGGFNARRELLKEDEMSEANKALARRFYEEVFGKGNLSAMDELCVPDLIDHNAMPGQGPGREGVKQMFALWFAAFSDMKVDIEAMVAEGDVVATRLATTATHTGELMGAPATGKRLTTHGIDMVRFRDGKAIEVWHYGDDMMMLAEIGVKMPS